MIEELADPSSANCIEIAEKLNEVIRDMKIKKTSSKNYRVCHDNINNCKKCFYRPKCNGSSTNHHFYFPKVTK